MNMIKKLQEILEIAGVFQYGIVDTEKIHFSNEIRKLCEANTCRNYSASWACPPAVGTVDECRQKCTKYNKMLVFSVKYVIEDSYDFEGMMKGLFDFKQVARGLETKIKAILNDYRILSNEGCGICEKCTYPNNPCRFPDKVHESIEGYGIYVNELAKTAGINYINGANTVTYFGALLFSD